MMNYYLKTEIKLLFRKKVYLVLSILLPLAFYLLFTSILDLPEAAQKPFYKEYMYSMTAFSLTSFCLMQFPIDLINDKTTGWYKNLMRTPLKAYQYYMVKIFKMMFQFILAIALIFIVAHVMKGVTMSTYDWILSGFVLWIGASTFLTVGVLLSQLNEIQKASSIGNILYLGLAILGGLWFPVSQFPEWMRKIAYITPTYHLKQIAYDIGKGDALNYVSLFVLLIYSILFLTAALIIQKRRDVDI
ncbi:ABC transporter permease [Staphylococcus caeli]|uniref:ABC transporter permease n=1 Tax=Staphylococcus caeli TaxID=2201815 RepID=UPI003F56BBB9